MKKKATLRQGYRVCADNETLVYGNFDETENEVLVKAIKYERYAHLAYKAMYYELVSKLNSVGLILVTDLEDYDCEE